MDTTKMRVAVNGVVRVAPVSTAAPTDATTSYGAGWVDLGATDDTGVKLADGQTNADFSVWQLFYPALSVVTARSFTIDVVLAEWNKAALSLAFGGASIASGKMTPPAPDLIDFRAFAVDWDAGGFHYRWIVPKVRKNTNTDAVLKRTAPTYLPLQFALYGQANVDPWDAYSTDPVWT